VIPTATSSIDQMESLTEKKLCRKGLHWYPITDKQCKECHKVTSSEWYQVNRERLRKKSKKWYLVNREYVLEKSKKWDQDNPRLRSKYFNKWAQANPELKREGRKRWAQANPDAVNALKARRRSAKKNALISWANASAIKKFYTEACRLTKLTGVKHHVDHIYPLQSEYMCGLHVETNLQILTEKENVAKGNRTWPGQLECQKGSVYARFPKELTALLND
jgi:hypothetical protein